MPRPKKPQNVIRLLREHDRRFMVYSKRGKASEVMLYHPDVQVRSQCFPMTFHKGQDIGKGMLKAIIRRFNLPEDIFG